MTLSLSQIKSNKENRKLKIEGVNLLAAAVFLELFCIYCGLSMPIYIKFLIIATIFILAIFGAALISLKYQIKNSSKDLAKEEKNK